MTKLKWHHDEQRFLCDVEVTNDFDQYRDVLFIEYAEDENSFYDQCGKHIDNIFDLITPNDVVLFKSNPKEFSYFSHRKNRNVLCRLIMNGVYKNENDNAILSWFPNGCRYWIPRYQQPT